MFKTLSQFWGWSRTVGHNITAQLPQNDRAAFALLVGVAGIIYFAFPASEMQADARDVLKFTLIGFYYDEPAGFWYLRWYLLNTLFYWWESLAFGREPLTSLPTIDDVKQSAWAAAVLVKLCGALSVGLFYAVARRLGADLPMALATATLFAVVTNHWMMSSTIDRHIIAQVLLLIFMFACLVRGSSIAAMGFSIFAAALAVVFLPLVYSPLILFCFVPAGLLVWKWIWERQFNRRRVLALCGVLLVAMGGVNISFAYFVGADFFDVLEFATRAFRGYGGLDATDEASRLTSTLIALNVAGLFEQTAYWGQWQRTGSLENLPSLTLPPWLCRGEWCEVVFMSGAKPSLLGIAMVIMVSGITTLIVWGLAFAPLRKLFGRAWDVKKLSAHAALMLGLLGIFLATLAFVYAVRHGNVAQFHLLPNTLLFLLLVLGNQSLWRTRAVALLAGFLFVFNLATHPYLGKDFEARNISVFEHPNILQWTNSTIILNPQRVFPRDRLRNWFAEAEIGDAEAQYHLGLSYYNSYGVPRDWTKAAYWYRKAAEQGHAIAQYYLGVAYHAGEGVERDETQALYWYRKAAQQGNVNARRNLKLLDAE